MADRPSGARGGRAACPGPAFAWLAAVAIGLASVGSAPAAESPADESCGLTTPPDRAGEQVRDGSVHRIYPRRRDIPRTYTGCQLVFAPRGDGWSIAESVRFRDGVVVSSSYAATPEAPGGECRFDGGRLVEGDRRGCPSPRQLPFVSLPPGCYAEVAEQGAIPERCRLE